MPPNLLIRPCLRDDIPAVTAIYRHAVMHGTGTFEIDPPERDEMAARWDRIVRQGYPYLVACAGPVVLGFAYVFAYRDRPAYRFTVEDSVYVRDDAHGKGVGTALIGRLVAESEARGFRQIVAVIGDSANAGSIRLHERAGFVSTGLLRAAGWKAGRWLDVVLMQRALGAGDATPPAAS